jgi:aminopeptidase N
MNIIAASPAATAQLPLFEDGLKSNSYAVQGAALAAMATLKPEQSLPFAKSFEKDSQGALTNSIVSVYAKSGSDAEWPYVYKNFTDADPQGKIDIIRDFIYMTAHLKISENAQQGITAIKEAGIKFKPYGFAPQIIQALEQIKSVRQQLNDAASVKLVGESIKQINDTK